MLSVAEVMEAMCSHRPFRPAYPVEVALNTIRSGAGTLFEEKAVEACLKVFGNGFEFVRQGT